MINRELYESALHLLGQPPEESVNEDYEERAPYILASFCTEAQEIDRFLRLAGGLSPAPAFEKVCLSLEKEFPLLERLSAAAALYLAAMLVLDEDSELSDTLYDRYCDSLASIRAGVFSASSSAIADCYF